MPQCRTHFSWVRLAQYLLKIGIAHLARIEISLIRGDNKKGRKEFIAATQDCRKDRWKRDGKNMFAIKATQKTPSLDNMRQYVFL